MADIKDDVITGPTWTTLRHNERGRQHGHGNCEGSDAPDWCHATVSQLTSRLATVAATCQHSNEHMVKVVVGEGDGSKTTECDNKYTISVSKGREKAFHQQLSAASAV